MVQSAHKAACSGGNLDLTFAQLVAMKLRINKRVVDLRQPQKKDKEKDEERDEEEVASQKLTQAPPCGLLQLNHLSVIIAAIPPTIDRPPHNG